MRPSSSSVRARWFLRILIGLLFLVPLLWMATAALHPPGSPLPQTLRLLPPRPTADNFARVWQLIPIGRFTLNSLLVVTLAVPLTLVVSSWAALAIARLPRRSQRRWVVISLAMLMVPGAALWTTRFLIYKQLGWIDTIWALIAPAWMGTSPFFVLMFYRAFRRIPAAIYDAARIDGADVLKTWSLIALPLARPTAIAVALLTLVLYWGDFNSPLLYIRSQELYTLPIALQLLQQMNRSDWSLLMAGALTATAIPILLFLLVQPFFSRSAD